MGTAIALRLIATGHEVRVWNRTADNARDAREAGGKWTPTLGELANQSEAVISSLLDNAGASERTSVLDVPRRWGDLNGWLQGAWSSFETEFAAELSTVIGPLTAPTVGSAKGAISAFATLA